MSSGNFIAEQMGRESDQYSREDMEEIGRRLMDALHSNRDALKGWHPGNCPTEIVSDLINARDEARDALRPFAGVPENGAAETAVPNESPVTIRCQLGAVRRARAALTGN